MKTTKMNITCFIVYNNENQKEKRLGLNQDNFIASYSQYCYGNIKYDGMDSTYRSLCEPKTTGKTYSNSSTYLLCVSESPYQNSSTASTHTTSMPNTCGVFTHGSSTFLFPIRYPIIDNSERFKRFNEFVVNIQRLSIRLKQYCQELRSLEMFQVLWKQIRKGCRNSNIRALLFIDLHLFCDLYLSTTIIQTDDERVKCTIFEVVVDKIRFEAGNVLGVYGKTERISTLHEKIKESVEDSDRELFYDRKLKSEKKEAGVKLTAEEIMLLKPSMLFQSFGKEDLLQACLRACISANAGTTTELKLLVRTGNDTVKSVYEGKNGDELLIARLVEKIHSMSWWLNKKQHVTYEDISVDGKLSSQVVVCLSVGLIKNIGYGVLYIEPSEQFKMIAHSTNFNGHIELGLFTHPKVQIKQLCHEIISESYNFVSQGYDQRKIKRILSYLILNGSYFSDIYAHC